MKPRKQGRKSPVKVTLHPNIRARAENLANQRNLSLSELVEDLLRLELAAPETRSLYAPLVAAEVEEQRDRDEAAGKPSTARRSSVTSKS